MVDIRRIERTLARFGERFEQRVFSETERAKAHRRPDTGRNNSRAATYAKRYAAKEACAKALGLGIPYGMAWRDVEVINLPSGKPTVKLHGKAMQRLLQLIPRGPRHIEITLTDEYPYASAMVIISREIEG